MELEKMIDAHRQRACEKTFTAIIRDGTREVCRGSGDTIELAIAKAENIAKHHDIRNKHIEIRSERQ